MRFDGEVFIIAKLPGGERFRAWVEVSTRWNEEARERRECGVGEDLAPLPYLLGEMGGGYGIDRATIPAARERNCRTPGHTISCGP